MFSLRSLQKTTFSHPAAKPLDVKRWFFELVSWDGMGDLLAAVFFASDQRDPRRDDT